MNPVAGRRRDAVTVAVAVVVAAVPLVVCVVLAEDRVQGLALGFVLTGVWVLILALTVQVTRARRVRSRTQQFPGPAGRRHDAAEVATAMVALAPPDWAGLRLEVDDDGRRLTVTRSGGVRVPVATLPPALHAAIDQLDVAVHRTDAPHHRMVLAASRDGTAKVTVE